MMLACDLDQAVSVPTRIQEQTASILYFVFHSKCLSDVHVSVDDGLSDHKLVLFTCRVVNQPEQMPVKQRVFKNFLKQMMNQFSITLI